MDTFNVYNRLWEICLDMQIILAVVLLPFLISQIQKLITCFDKWSLISIDDKIQKCQMSSENGIEHRLNEIENDASKIQLEIEI